MSLFRAVMFGGTSSGSRDGASANPQSLPRNRCQRGEQKRKRELEAGFNNFTTCVTSAFVHSATWPTSILNAYKLAPASVSALCRICQSII